MIDPKLTETVRPDSLAMFNALRDPEYTNFALLSVNYDGEPTEAIVAITQDETDYIITPVAVLPTDRMRDRLLNPHGEGLSGSEAEGEPED